jgi:hypothetical protein
MGEAHCTAVVCVVLIVILLQIQVSLQPDSVVGPRQMMTQITKIATFVLMKKIDIHFLHQNKFALF